MKKAKARKPTSNSARGRNRRAVRLKQPPVLFDRTQKILRALSERLGGMFLTYWTSPNGSVCDSDVQALYEVLQIVGSADRVALFVKSSGGNGQSALRLVHLLRAHGKHLSVLVPLECASAATMLALGADEILLGPLGFLTPIDTSLEHALGPVDPKNESAYVGQDELSRALALWAKHSPSNAINPFQELYKYLHPLVIGAADRATSLSIRLCREILLYHMTSDEQAQSIATRLNSEYPTHDYPITAKEGRSLGLNMGELPVDVNDQLLELNGVYSEMGQRAVTDFDEFNYHDNEIVNIVEGVGVQLFFQNDKDWHYRKEERQWVSLNVESSWHRSVLKNRRVQRTKLHIA